MGFFVGVIVFIFCLFLAQAFPIYFTTLSSSTLNLLKIGFLIMGGLAIFIGALSK